MVAHQFRPNKMRSGLQKQWMEDGKIIQDADDGYGGRYRATPKAISDRGTFVTTSIYSRSPFGLDVTMCTNRRENMAKWNGMGGRGLRGLGFRGVGVEGVWVFGDGWLLMGLNGSAHERRMAGHHTATNTHYVAWHVRNPWFFSLFYLLAVTVENVRMTGYPNMACLWLAFRQ